VAAIGPPPFDHLIALSDDTGIFQHATFDVPNRAEGYCTDDVARAFIVAVRASAHADLRPVAIKLGRTYLSFLHAAQRPNGRFHNFMSFERVWLDDVGSEDCSGRACWALGVGARGAPQESWRRLCARLLHRTLPQIATLAFPRAAAFAALGITAASSGRGPHVPALGQALERIGSDLVDRLRRVGTADWRWFEDVLTYDNARLPEALLRIGMALDDPTFVEAGLEALDFYESVVVENGMFVPIGNRGWYPRGGPRARYGQQPLEAAALVDAALAAHAASGRPRYRRLAECAYAWYVGGNSRGAVMVRDGGCCDGLDAEAVNPNMGAESTLSFLASALAMSGFEAQSRPTANRTG